MTTISFANSLYLNNSSTLSYSEDNSSWTPVSTYPVTLTYTGGSTGNVYLQSNLTFSASNNYFIIGSQNITFDGSNNTVTISSVTGYNGLFQNGTNSVSGFSNTLIKNIIMNCATSTVSSNNGWFAQTYYSRGSTNNILQNLSSNGPMTNDRTAGICGSWSGSNNGSLTITNCHSSGNISKFESGGICGARMGDVSGTVIISNCYSTGNISGATESGMGAICGNGAGYNGGTVTISDCYSSGTIGADSCGGICGNYTAGINGTVSITNCYSTGEISGNYGGGICGADCGSDNGTFYISNCYSLGNITGTYSGGIAGTWFGEYTNNPCSIANCYTRGNVTGLNAGGICGSGIGYVDSLTYNPTITISNCYSYGTIDASGGSIVGGDAGYAYNYNQVTVDISNCYTVNGPFVSPTSPVGITFNYANSSVGSGTWNDITASTYLANAPTYSSGFLTAQGATWVDKDPLNLTTPFIFDSSFSPVITNLTPSSGFANNSVTITGTDLSYNSTVIFGDSIATVSQNTGTTITCLSPSSSTVGQVPVYVATDYGAAITYFTYNSVCFNEDTKILCKNKQGEEEYIPIQNLRKGDLVKTCRNGFKPIDCIGKSTLLNPDTTERTKDRLYILKNDKYPELFEDLIITGCHSVLVDTLTDEQRKKSEEIFKYICITDNKYRLMACVDERAEPYSEGGKYTIYHLALENDDYYMNYGIYANGLLVETTSKRWIRELSGMTFLE